MIEEILLAVRGLERSSIDNRYEGASASEVIDTFIKANHWFSIDLGHDLEDDEVKTFLAWIDKYSIAKDLKITEEADHITLNLLSDTRLSKNFLENNMEEIGLRVLRGPY